MKIIKPSYLNDKNLISYLLTPFTIFTILIGCVLFISYTFIKGYKIKD